MRTRLAFSLVMGIADVALLGLAAAEVDAAQRGGTFVILTRNFGVPDELDPARAYTVLSWELLGASCALLLRRQEAQPPAGYRLVPEAAASLPTVSRDGKTYTFTIRGGRRFADGKPLTARNFADAITRLRDPRLESPGALFVREVVSTRAVRANRLVIRLSRPVPDFQARLAMPFFCPVPLGLPAEPEGTGAPFSGAGPYYVSTWKRNSEFVLQRNRFYRGTRRRHVDRLVVRYEDNPDTAVEQVERGEADLFVVTSLPVTREQLRRKYGVNRSQYFVVGASTVWYLHLNSERALFRNNQRLRRAINLAVDRRAFLRAFPPGRGNATDQILPPTMPGFRNAHIYPLKGPNLARARALARGRTRGGRAVMYTWDFPSIVAAAQTVRSSLKRIGLDIEIKAFPPREAHARATTRGEPFDIFYTGWIPDYIDPYHFLGPLLDGRMIRDRENANVAYFNSSAYNRELDRANRLSGDARYRAFGELDIRTMRDEAPIVPLYRENISLFVSKRAGCLLFNGYEALNLGAVCLK